MGKQLDKIYYIVSTIKTNVVNNLKDKIFIPTSTINWHAVFNNSTDTFVLNICRAL